MHARAEESYRSRNRNFASVPCASNMSTTLEASINETNNQEYNEKDLEEVNTRSYRLLKAEEEKCRQEVYDLRRKLELNEVMLREVQEANELLERNLEELISKNEKIVCDTKEKSRVTTEKYENTISDLEAKLAEQETDIQRLHQQINQQKKTECAQTVAQSANISLEADNVLLKKRVDQLTVQLREEKLKCGNAEETIGDLREQCHQLQHDFRDIKEQLNEKSTDLEEARAVLASNRMEAASLNLNVNPTNDLSKGNSLFAEIEDRRRDTVNKTNALYRKYAEVKRTCALQMAEITMLKKERVSALNDWENNAGNVSAEMQELLQKYKSRVSDLERKLKSEIKKNEQSDQENTEPTTFVYYQSLVHAKKKEINELRVKVEDLSTHLLVQEETKMNIGKQLKHSQYKISSLEAQVQVLQVKSKLSQEEDNANTEKQFKEFQDTACVDNNNVKAAEFRIGCAQQQGNTDFMVQGKKDILDSMKTEKTTSRNVVTQIATSRETCKSKRIENDDKDKNICPAKTVQFSKNVVHIRTNANM